MTSNGKLFSLCLSIIRDDIIPHAVYWYTREAIPGNELDLDDDDDDVTIYGDDSNYDDDGGAKSKSREGSSRNS